MVNLNKRVQSANFIVFLKRVELDILGAEFNMVQKRQPVCVMYFRELRLLKYFLSHTEIPGKSEKCAHLTL